MDLGGVDVPRAEAIRARQSTAQRSAPGSAMAVTYYAEHTLLTLFRRPVDLAFRVIGEPLRHITTRERFAALAKDTGWRVREDSGTEDWSERYGFGSSALLWMTERLALLERE
jgi:O-methyltransferase involved in polyketide biosynthesis